MKQTPTLFQRPMVQAIVREVDPKTQTRRHVKGEALDWLEAHNFTPEFVALPENRMSPYGYAGDQIYVKETFFAWGRWETRFSAKKGRDEWHFVDMTLETGHQYVYAADGIQPALLGRKRSGGVSPAWWKRPAIFMPRTAVRIWLEVVSVRIERVQAINEVDAIAEGAPWAACGSPQEGSHKAGYAQLWESINGPGSWDVNPWAWVVEFKRISGATQ
ncbi:MAG: hypothetical protein U5L73_11530 [Rhodoferax sp.]|uniref:hypothetical protein n=1 Tax=Rhodoferax sp. TaxID=50421 RepID=UPI002ACD669F|nr:hypothetical protein [Rhodoferax sp.]MDZ7892374.1 hypothetical protein [Rhodoferax sp.]